MDYNKIIKKLKTFILDELEIAQLKDSTVKDKLDASSRAYGALQFVNNEVFPYNEELADWWHEIRPKFLE